MSTGLLVLTGVLLLAVGLLAKGEHVPGRAGVAVLLGCVLWAAQPEAASAAGPPCRDCDVTIRLVSMVVTDDTDTGPGSDNDRWQIATEPGFGVGRLAPTNTVTVDAHEEGIHAFSPAPVVFGPVTLTFHETGPKSGVYQEPVDILAARVEELDPFTNPNEQGNEFNTPGGTLGCPVSGTSTVQLVTPDFNGVGTDPLATGTDFTIRLRYQWEAAA